MLLFFPDHFSIVPNHFCDSDFYTECHNILGIITDVTDHLCIREMFCVSVFCWGNTVVLPIV
jgi:hypothetical protein